MTVQPIRQSPKPITTTTKSTTPTTPSRAPAEPATEGASAQRASRSPAVAAYQGVSSYSATGPAQPTGAPSVPSPTSGPRPAPTAASPSTRPVLEMNANGEFVRGSAPMELSGGVSPIVKPGESVVVSGQPGTDTLPEHFLANGLARAEALRQQGGATTWIVFNDKSAAGNSPAEIQKYKEKADQAGIKLIETSDPSYISRYLNTGGTTAPRTAANKVTNFVYVGHAMPGGRMAVDFQGHGKPDPRCADLSSLSANAFASGAKVNLDGACNTAVANAEGVPSLVSRFQKLVDNRSTVLGTNGQTNFYTTAVDTDQELIDHNKPAAGAPQTTRVIVHGSMGEPARVGPMRPV